jgi:uridine kinase
MTTAKRSGVEPAGDSPAAVVAEKRVILSIGGKGGVGKTSVMAGLAEWFDANQIPVKLWTSTRRTRRADR